MDATRNRGYPSGVCSLEGRSVGSRPKAVGERCSHSSCLVSQSESSSITEPTDDAKSCAASADDRSALAVACHDGTTGARSGRGPGTDSGPACRSARGLVYGECGQPLSFSELKHGDVVSCRAQMQSAVLRKMTEELRLGVNSVQLSEAFAILQEKDVESAVDGDRPFLVEIGLDGSITREATQRGHFTANAILNPGPDSIDQLSAFGTAADVVRKQKPFVVFISSTVPASTLSKLRKLQHNHGGILKIVDEPGISEAMVTTSVSTVDTSMRVSKKLSFLVCKQALTLLREAKWPTCRTRRNVSNTLISACAVGAVHNFGRGLWLGKHSWNFRHLIKAVSLIIASVDRNFRYTTIQLNKNYASKLHVDGNNQGWSALGAFGNFTGGRIWIYNPNGKVVRRLTENVRGWPHHKVGDEIRGNFHDVRNRVIFFDGRIPHFVEPYTGERYSFVGFTSRLWPEQAPSDLVDCLEHLGIRTPPLKRPLRSSSGGGASSECAETVRLIDEAEDTWHRRNRKLIEERYLLDTGNCSFISETFPAEAEVNVDGGDEPIDEDVASDEEKISDSESELSDVEEQTAEDDTEEPPSKELLRALMNMHVNTGHKSLKRLARALVIAGAPRSTVRAVKRLKCSVCQERRNRGTRRPATLPKARYFGDRVHIDLVKCWDAADVSRWCVNIVDAASGFQVCARVKDKTSEEVIRVFRTTWATWAGYPSVLVADLGPEFASVEFTTWMESHECRVYHTPVESPWQNGIAERAGGIFKAVLAKNCAEHSVVTEDEFDDAVSIANAARNGDINDSGFSADQWILGRAKKLPADVLSAGGVRGNLSSHGSPLLGFHKRLAMMETARQAITRVHFSKRLRSAELARARTVPDAVNFKIGDMVYFYRESMKSSGQQRKARNAKQMLLKTWHGPGVVVGKEGNTAIYVGYRGNSTKCAPESVRMASAFEQIAAESWSELITDVLEHSKVEQAPRDPPQAEAERMPDVEQRPPRVSRELDALPEVPAPKFARTEPSQDAGAVLDAPSNNPLPSVPALPSFEADGETSAAMPIEDVDAIPALMTPGEAGEPAIGEDSHIRSRSPRRNVTLETVRDKHPLMEVWESIPQDKLPEKLPYHGTLRGNTSMFSLRSGDDVLQEDATRFLQELHRDAEVFLTETSGRRSPSTAKERVKRDLARLAQLSASDAPSISYMAQSKAGARKELSWKQLSQQDKDEFTKAADKHWQQWLDLDAVEKLSAIEASQVRSKLLKERKQDLIMKLRWVLTDKNAPKRTADNPLGLEASARLVLPGYKDPAKMDGSLRCDAPTGTRISQHLLFTATASNKHWKLASADVRAAFLKGDPYMDREMYVTPAEFGPVCTEWKSASGLYRVKKGVFGLADAPRQWYLRLCRCMKAHGWTMSFLDQACWYKWSPKGELQGMIVGHVDDLLFGGNDIARQSLDAIGKELGFGSLTENDFTWCGKRIQKTDECVRVSMEAYHRNLSTTYVSQQRRKQGQDAPLTPREVRVFRAQCGSLQWLVAQLRVDLAFKVSTLQSELRNPTVGSLLRANSLITAARASAEFELTFRPINLASAGLVVVTDAALGNVNAEGSNLEPPQKKLHSQAGHLILMGDRDLCEGRTGTFNVLDFRSHRLGRICRSSFAAETYALEEGVDQCEVIRGQFAEMLGIDISGCRKSPELLQRVPVVAVTDAKDTHDKALSDTSTHGAQKSLAFSVGFLKQYFRQPATALRWVETENQLSDALTKDMEATWLCKTLDTGRWSISFCRETIRPKKQPKKPKS